MRDRIGANLVERCRRGSPACASCRRSAGSAAFTRRFHETNEAQYDANLETVRISARYFPIVEFAGVAGMAVIVGIGGWFVADDIVTVGTVAAFVLYLNNLFEPIQQLSQLYNSLQQAGAALQKLFDLLDTRAVDRRAAGRRRPPRAGCARARRTCRSGTATGTCSTTCRCTCAPGERVALVGPDRRREVDAGQAHRPLLRPA